MAGHGGQSHDQVLDMSERQLRGNLPQAFVHAAMLECAVTLSPDVNLGTL